MKNKTSEIETVKVGRSGEITFNVAGHGFEEGENVNIIKYDDRFEIRPIKNKKYNMADSAWLASQEVLAENWLSEEDEEAWKDL
jgi:hypothetical protein